MHYGVDRWLAIKLPQCYINELIDAKREQAMVRLDGRATIEDNAAEGAHVRHATIHGGLRAWICVHVGFSVCLWW